MPATTKQLEFDRQLDRMKIKEFRRTGDMEVLGELYSKYMHLVYGVCLKYFKNRDKAQDAVIQIFEKLTIEAVKQEISNFKSWLYVVTKNFCLNELRKENAEEEKFRKWQNEQQDIMESGFEIHPIDNETKLNDALLSCIEKLKDEQKQTIDLFYFQKKCYKEISELMKIEEKKVKSYIQNGKRNLKFCLERRNGG